MNKINKFIVLLLSATIYLNASIQNNEYKFEKLNKNVYVMHGPVEEPNEKNKGFMNNPAAIIGKNAVTIIDPGGSLYAGNLVISSLKSITNKPIIAVINTHIHGDHWLANKVIKENFPNAVIYAHPMMIKRAKSGEAKAWIKMVEKLTNNATKGMTPVYPQKETSNLQKLVIGSETFIIHNPTNKSHTNTDIMIEHVQSKTMFLGDNAFIGRFGGFGNDSDMHENIKALEYAKAKNMIVYVPGHGRSGNVEQSLQPYLNYLVKLKNIVKTAYEDDVESFEIKESAIKELKYYENWDTFHEKVGKHISKMYQEIEALDM